MPKIMAQHPRIENTGSTGVNDFGHFGGPGIYRYSHPEVDRLWVIEGMYYGSVKDHISSTPGWPCVYACIYIFILYR